MADEPWKAEADEDEEDLEISDVQYKTVKDAVLFTIEVSPSMLESPAQSQDKKGAQDSGFLASLKCAYELLTQRIISQPNDLIGVLLHGVDTRKLEAKFGVPEAKEIDELQGCYMLINLGIPSADDIKKLKTLIEHPDEIHESIVPSSEPVSIANTIFSASQIFSVRAANFISRRLFIVTDNDRPHGTDERIKIQATQRAKDLYDLGVTIDLFPLVRPDEKFDKSKFYDDIIYNSEPTDPDAPASISQAAPQESKINGIDLLASLLSSIRSRITPKRALFSNLPLNLGPGLTISVKGYLIFKRQEPRRTQYVYMGHEPLLVKSDSIKVSGDTHQVIERTAQDKEEERKAYRFGGDQILFTKQELAEVRHFGEPGITIIGFKNIDKETLPIWANIKGATYIYPSEEEYIGSSRVFSALYQKMLSDNKMALVWFIARKNATPQIAAMVPGTRKEDDTGATIIPEGLWVCPLPYIDDLRQNPETVKVSAADELIDKMRVIVQQLQLPKGQYVPSKYPNPALQYHYRVLQSIALGEDHPEPEDKIIPKYKQIAKRTGAYVQEWAEELEVQQGEWRASNKPAITMAKRPAAPKSNGDGNPARKKSKLVDAGDVDETVIRTAWEQNSLAKFTVPELKSFLSAKGISMVGKKQELVDRVEEYYETK